MMTRLKSARLVRDFGALFGAGTLADLGDGPLLERFVARRDEAAFEELIARHGPLVLAICRRWLDDPHDVEDAFQATFLLLVRKAAALRDRSAVSCWLQGVALRVARRARANAARRRLRESPIVGEPPDRPRAGTGDEEVLAAVDEEIRRLPGNQQLAVALCLLEGYTHEAAASQLGWPLGTVKSRIAAARRTLARRLTRRGLEPSIVAATLRPGPGPVGTIPPGLVRATIAAGLGVPSAAASATSLGLAREVSQVMLVARVRSVVWLVLAGGVLAWAAPALWNTRPAEQGTPFEVRSQVSPAAAAPPSRPKVDRYGDPLPSGAAMRLGTVRFRQFPHVCNVGYSPDGRFVVTATSENTLQFWDARDGRKLRLIDGGMEQIRDFAFSPDGTQIAVVGWSYVPDRLRRNTHLAFLDVATGRLIRHAEWDLKAGDQDLAYSPDGQTVAVKDDGGILRLWDVASAQLLREEPLGDRQNFASIAFSPVVASRLLAIASGKVIRIRDAGTLRDVRTIVVEGEHQPTNIAFSPDGMTLAAGIERSGTEIRLWRVSDGALLKCFKARNSGPEAFFVSHVLFSPDGKILAAVGSGIPLTLFDVESGHEWPAFGKDFDLVGDVFEPDATMAFSPDGKTLATIAARQSLHFWELGTARDRLATPEAHLGGVYDVAMPADGKTLISGSNDRTVRVWDLATGRPTKVFPHDGWVWSLAVSADGKFLAVGVGYPGNVHLWNLETGERIHAWPFAGASSDDVKLRAVTLSRDGSTVVVVMADGSLLGWDLRAGKERAIAQSMRKKPLDPDDAAALPPVLPSLAAFSRDGRSKVIARTIPGKSIKLASGEIREDRASIGSAIVWLDTETGHARREIEIPQSNVQRLALSPDDQLVAVGYFSTTYPYPPARGFIRIFRLRDKQLIRTIELPCPWIDALRFTPDGKQIVAGLQDSSIVIWDVAAPDGEREDAPAPPAGRPPPG